MFISAVEKTCHGNAWLWVYLRLIAVTAHCISVVHCIHVSAETDTLMFFLTLSDIYKISRSEDVLVLMLERESED